MKKLILSVLTACSVISAQATVFNYSVSFSDQGEPLPSPGATGFGSVAYDNVAHTLSLSVTFSGLQGNTTASHIHSPTAVAFSGGAGVATTTPSLAGFPLGVTSGTFNTVLDLTQSSSWNPNYVTAKGGTTALAESAFASEIAAGKAYWNIHSTYSTGGEIRAFLTAVPEPSTYALAGLGFIGMAARFWNKKRTSKV